MLKADHRAVWGNPDATRSPAARRAPGHISFAVASRNSRMLVQSGVTNIPGLFLRNPDWHVAYDHDPNVAQKTPHRLYDMAATENMLMTGYHFSFPSAEHVEKDSTGYRLVPVAWSAAP